MLQTSPGFAQCLSRRAWMRGVLGAAGCTAIGCAPAEGEEGPWPDLDLPWDDGDARGLDLVDVGEVERLEIEALMEVLLPSDVDEDGVVVGVGAREVRAFDVMRIRRFVPLAQSRGLLPRALGQEFEDAAGIDRALIAVLAADLGARAAERILGLPFRDLPREEQEQVVRDAFEDPRRRDLYQVPRAACMLAYLGALYTEEGLVAVGFPPFADRGERLANTGYPRTPDGVIANPAAVDMAALRADGRLDHYSYDRRPDPTDEDDLSGVLSSTGDLF